MDSDVLWIVIFPELNQECSERCRTSSGSSPGSRKKRSMEDAAYSVSGKDPKADLLVSVQYSFVWLKHFL